MKKIIISSLFISLALGFFSCVKDEEDVFDSSASARMQERLAEIRNNLVSAPNGWIVEFYANTNDIGGYTMLMMFDADGRVGVSTEFELATAVSITPADTVWSSYSVKSDTGPTISFDTYNDIIHFFSDPYPNGTGYSGDFEFTVMNITQDVISLKGTKHGRLVTMRRMDAGMDWIDYLDAVYEMAEKWDGWNKTVLQYGTGEYDNEVVTDDGSRLLTYYQPDQDGVEIGYTIPFAYTDKGFRFQEPVELFGKTVQEFVFDEDGDLFRSVESGVNYTISEGQIYISEFFRYTPYTWYVQSDMSQDMRDLYDYVDDMIYYNEGMALFWFSLGPVGYPSYGMSRAMEVIITPNGSNVYACQYDIAYRPVRDDATNRQVKLMYTRDNAANGSYFYKYLSDFMDAFAPTDEGAVYEVILDDEENPTLVTLRGVANPDKYLTFSRTRVLFP